MDSIDKVLMLLLVVVVLFAIGREFMCWYWKFNKMVALLENISMKLDHITSNGPSSMHGNQK